MATTQVGNVIFQISADIKNIQGQLRTLEGSFQSSFNRISGMGKSLAASLGVGLSLGSLVAYGKQIINLGSQMQDLGQQTGFTASTLSGFKSTLEENGTTVEAFANAMFQLQRRIADVDKTTDPLIETIKRLGLNFDELRQASSEEVAKKVIEALAKIPDVATRAAIGYALMGRQFREFSPAIEELAKSWEKLKRSGLTDKEAAQLDKFGDSLTRLWNRLLLWSSQQALKAIENLSKLRDALEERGVVPPRPGHGLELGGMEDVLKQSRIAGVPTVKALIDPEAERKTRELQSKINSLTDSFKAQLVEQERVRKEFELGEEEALRYSLTQKVVNELGEKYVASYQKVIDQIVAMTMANKERELSIRRLNEELRQEEELEKKLDQALAVTLDLQHELERVSMDDFTRQLDDINEKFKLMQERNEELRKQGFGVSPEDIERARQFALAVAEIKEQERAWGEEIKTADFTARLSETQQAFGEMFDSITRGLDSTLQGIMQGTQTFGEGMRNLARNMLLSFNEELLRLGVFNPIKNLILQWTEGLNLITPGAGGPMFNFGFGGGAQQLAGPAEESLGWLSSLFGGLFAQRGGIVPGSPSQMVPVMAHGGERIIPYKDRGKESGVRVMINGDIVPREPNLRPQDVIQIVTADFDNRGLTLQTAEARMRR